MPIYAIFAIRNETGKVTKEAFCLEKFGFFARITIKNVLRALAIEFNKNVKAGFNDYSEIIEKMETEEIVIATIKDANKRVLLITDIEYNSAVRHKAANMALNTAIDYNKLIEEYKNWKNKDLSTQIDQELKKVNENVVRGLASVLDRGQTLNDLVEKSENLSSQTKKLFKTAKKQNACC